MHIVASLHLSMNQMGALECYGRIPDNEVRFRDLGRLLPRGIALSCILARHAVTVLES